MSKVVKVAALGAAAYFTGGAALGATGTGAAAAQAGFTAAATGTAATTMGGVAGAAGVFGGASTLSAATLLNYGGKALSALAALEVGSQGYAAANYNAQLAQQNAILSRRKAKEDARRLSIRSRKEMGAARAAYAAAGVTLEGTPTDILDESAYIAELDALTLKEGGMQSSNAYKAQSRLNKSKGRSALRGSYLSASSFLLS